MWFFVGLSILILTTCLGIGICKYLIAKGDALNKPVTIQQNAIHQN